MLKNSLILFVITSLFFTFSCNNNSTTAVSNGNASEPSKKEAQTQLNGTWYAVNYPLGGKPYAPSQFYKVTFDGSSFGIQLSMNSCGGEFSIPKTGVIKISENTFCTKACCDNEESEALMALFRGELSYSISQNMLTIQTPSGDIKLQNNIESIQGSTWAAFSYADRKENKVIEFKEPYVLTFGKEGVQLRLNANTCNTSCTYLDKENSFELSSNGSMACTRVCCDNDDAILLMKSLQGKISYKKDGESLVLKTFNKEIILVPFVDIEQD